MDKPFYKSKKFNVTVSSLLLIVLNAKLGLGLDPDTVQTLMIPVVAYVLGQGIADTSKKPQ